MVSDENLAYLKRHGRTHPTWTDELPLNVTCLDSCHPNILRRQQWKCAQPLATVAESASDIRSRTSVGWVMAVIQVRTQFRGEGTQEVQNDNSQILSFDHYQTLCAGYSISAIGQFGIR